MLYSNPPCIRRIVFLGLFLLTVFCSIPTSQISAETMIWKDVTVITVSGLHYRDIDIGIAPSGKEIVLVKEDSIQQTIRISNINMILDSEGEDITEQILYNAENNEKLMTDEEMGYIYKRYSFGISASIGYGWTALDWFEGITSGSAFTIDMHYLFSSRGTLGVQYRYQKLGVDNELEGEFYVCDDYSNCMDVNIDWNVHLSEYFIYFGGATKPKTLRKPIGYLLLGFGLIDHRMEITVSDDSYSESASDDMIKFAMLLAGGITVPVNRHLGVKLEADLRTTGDNYYPFASFLEEATTLGILFGLEVGIVYMFGGEM
jgi:hypothetical protein